MRYYESFDEEEQENSYAENVDKKLSPILAEDDTEKFLKFMEDEKEKVGVYNYKRVIQQCIDQDARKCTLVFLKNYCSGESDILFDFHPIILVDLFYDWNDPQLLQVMLNDCHGHFLANQRIQFDFLPIHSLLLVTMNDGPFSEWSTGDSLIKLIILLISAPSTRQRLKCVQLLAESTNPIDKVAVGFFHGGDVKELAALLLLAFDKAFPPLANSGLIKEPVDDMLSRAVHGGNPDVYGLVHLFDKAGDSLSNYYTSMSEDEKLLDVIIEVARLIQKAGFPITYKDVDFTDTYSLERDEVDSIHKALGVKLDDDNEKDQKIMFPSVYCIPPLPPPGVRFMLDDIMVFRHRRFNPKVFQQARQFSTAPQHLKITASKKVWSNPSLRSVAFLAMKLKRGIRYDILVADAGTLAPLAVVEVD